MSHGDLRHLRPAAPRRTRVQRRRHRQATQEDRAAGHGPGPRGRHGARAQPAVLRPVCRRVRVGSGTLRGHAPQGRAALAATDLEVRWLDLPGEEIPLDDDSVDSIVLTYTLCTIADWEGALAQMRRVLTPGRSVAVLRARRSAGRVGASMAAPDRSGVDTTCRRVPHHPADPGVDRGRRIRTRRGRLGLSAGSHDRLVPLVGPRQTTLTPPDVARSLRRAPADRQTKDMVSPARIEPGVTTVA